MKYLKLIWLHLKTREPFPGARFALLLLLVEFLIVWRHAQAATPTVQMCTTGTNSIAPDALLGCPRANLVFGVPKLSTDLIRAQTPAQKWIPYSQLTAGMLVYGGSPADWKSPASLGIPLYTGTPPTTPTNPTTVTVPPQTWTCTSDSKTVTCTTPAIAGATP